MRRLLSLRVVLLGSILSLVATTFYFHAARAATPSSGAINTPPDNTLGVRQTISYFGGPMLVSTGFSNYSLPVCLQAVAPPGARHGFTLALNLPANYWDPHPS